MPIVDCVVETKVSTSVRARQVQSLFDVPDQKKSRLEWSGEVPIDDGDWNVGLIVGPSGSGKSTIGRQLFKDNFHPEMEWSEPSVIDDCSKDLSVKDITAAFSAVGFNTIPAWLRPYEVLSNGEKFRVDLARRLLEIPDPIVMDEFTSVVDRQVARIGCHAVQKFIRKNKRKFVAITCHNDIEDWLQPDWILEPSTMLFRRRSLRRRPEFEVEIKKVDRKRYWPMFAPFHYLSNELLRNAQCFSLFIEGQPAVFCGVRHFPHPKVNDIKAVSRVVTLPDWQGLGLAFVLMDSLGGLYRRSGYRFRMYPTHPGFVRSFDRSSKWRMVKKPGVFNPRGKNSTLKIGGRPCAVFEYVAASSLELDVDPCEFLGLKRHGRITA